MGQKVSHRPGAAARRKSGAEQDSLGLERLVFFSDAVFAIAITLLTLEIRLPAGGESSDNAQLLVQLGAIWHKYLAYVISFLTVGIFWIGHHRKFRLIRRYDSRLLMLNLVTLMAIAFVPFPTSVISENSNRTATIFYALTMALVGLLMAAVWWHASRHNRLIDADLTPRQRRQALLSPLVTTAIFVASIGLAFVDEDLAKFSWLLILPASLYVHQE